MSGTAKTILLVEPDCDLRRAIREILEAFDYKVLVASSGDRAIESCFPDAHHIDGMVVASALPDLTGVELVDSLRALGRRVPALLLATIGADKTLEQRVASGDVDLLRVPFSAEVLRHKLQQMHKRPVDLRKAEE